MNIEDYIAVWLDESMDRSGGSVGKLNKPLKTPSLTLDQLCSRIKGMF